MMYWFCILFEARLKSELQKENKEQTHEEMGNGNLWFPSQEVMRRDVSLGSRMSRAVDSGHENERSCVRVT